MGLAHLGVTFGRRGHLDAAIQLEEQAASLAAAAQADRILLRINVHQALLRLERGTPTDLAAARSLAEAACSDPRMPGILQPVPLLVLARVGSRPRSWSPP